MSITTTDNVRRRRPATLADPTRDYSSADQIVASLVAAAKNGDESAWEDLVKRYQPLVTSIARKFRLSPTDAADVSQIVWLKLLHHLKGLREPRALIGWISIITRNVCLDLVASQRRTTLLDPQVADTSFDWSRNGPWADKADDGTIDEGLRRHECQLAIRQGLAELAPAQRNLLLLLAADPPVPYEQISRELGLPIGSIGPSRARFLKKLSNTDAVRRLIGAPMPAANKPAAA